MQVENHNNGKYTVTNSETGNSYTLTPAEIATLQVGDSTYKFLIEGDGTVHYWSGNGIPSNHRSIVDNAVLDGEFSDRRPFEPLKDSVSEFDFSWL